MSVLLPTGECWVLSPQTTLDGHGVAAVYAWTQRGPFPFSRSGHAPTEQQVDVARTVYGVTLILDPAAAPVTSRDRIFDGSTLFEVVGATVHPDLAGAPLAHVEVTALVLDEAP